MGVGLHLLLSFEPDEPRAKDVAGNLTSAEPGGSKRGEPKEKKYGTKEKWNDTGRDKGRRN